MVLTFAVMLQRQLHSVHCGEQCCDSQYRVSWRLAFTWHRRHEGHPILTIGVIAILMQRNMRQMNNLAKHWGGHSLCCPPTKLLGGHVPPPSFSVPMQLMQLP